MFGMSVTLLTRWLGLGLGLGFALGRLEPRGEVEDGGHEERLQANKQMNMKMNTFKRLLDTAFQVGLRPGRRD